MHLPVAVTLSTAWFTRRGWVYSTLYVLFENAMGTVKLWAVITGGCSAVDCGRSATCGGLESATSVAAG